MQIVIDIPEEIYDFVQITFFVEDENTLFKQTNAERRKTLFLFDILDAIRNGTPLPEGHGRLIDADAIDWFKGEDENGNPCYIFDKRDLSLEPTVLEADGSEENAVNQSMDI